MKPFPFCEVKMVHERNWQHSLIKEIKRRLPGAYVIKTNANYIQGFPDILVLYKRRWAALECKRERTAAKQPNQEYYVDRLNDLSFAAFIYPENQEEILNGLQQALGSS